MAVRPDSPGWQSFEQRGFPAIIAHAAGNKVRSAEQAMVEGADFIEVDIWFRNSRFEARHERRMGPIPLLFEKWYLSRAPASPFTLSALVDHLGDSIGIFLDFKTSQRETADRVAQILETAPPGLRIAASSQWWPILRQLHDRLPDLPLFYSIDVEAKLDLFRSVILRDSRPAGISCRESLLTPSLVHEMHERGLRVVAWTVDDLSRSATLASWGVDGITTHLVADTHTLLAAVP
jgi:glycerophosphoryl diester phosphodiesterase